MRTMPAAAACAGSCCPALRTGVAGAGVPGVEIGSGAASFQCMVATVLVSIVGAGIGDADARRRNRDHGFIRNRGAVQSFGRRVRALRSSAAVLGMAHGRAANPRLFIAANLYVVSYVGPGGRCAAHHAAPYRPSGPQHLTPLASWQALRRSTRLLVLQGKPPFDARSFPS